MDPDLLLQAVYTVLHRDPPAGLDAHDVDRFFERNRAGLLQAVRQAFPVAAIERAFTRLREEHRLARLVFDATERHLAARGPASQGAELADFIDAIDDHVAYEDRTLFPYLRGQLPSLAASIDHAREEHEYVAEHLFALAADLRAGRRYQGPALEAARHHFDEEETQLVAPALAAGLARTPAGQPGRLLAFAADIERLAEPAPAPVLASTATPTRWGGLRGRVLQPGEIDQNTRVVTEQGEHGLVTEVHAIVVRALIGGRADDDIHYSYVLRLDSGRTASPRGQLYEERAAPATVVPDVEVGARWLAPAEVWSQVLGRLRDISSYAEKAENARKPEMKRRWQQHRVEARQEFLELVRLLAGWRQAHPDEPVEGLDERRWRLVTLEAKEPRTEDESWELAWLRRVPPDWSTRFKVGDPVVIHVLGPYGRQPDPGWTVAEIRGHEAILSRGEVARAEPLWMLKADDAALGERPLAAGRPGSRAGATADPRAQAAEGCRELDFDLPGHGRVRVVCGEQGRRDLWHNIWIGPERYGFNGGRWARNQRPPDAVLAAIRERGVMIFG